MPRFAAAKEFRKEKGRPRHVGSLESWGEEPGGKIQACLPAQVKSYRPLHVRKLRLLAPCEGGVFGTLMSSGLHVNTC